jgi:1-pyrroline-5-carboxylate dehydrogenase
MSNGIFSVPFPDNDPIRNYEPGSRDKEILKKRMQELKSEVLDIPIIIGGKEIRTGNTATCVATRDAWAEMPWNERAAIFLKAADLLTTDYWRSTLNAATMLGQSKTAFQAEIDAACELVDFFRFNAYYAQQIYEEQPMYSPEGQWNRMEYRPLEGFVFAVAPFNFTSIAGNLPTSPALMGNVVIMKPASSAVYSGYWLMKLFIEAGVPDGVINFVPGSGSQVGNPVLESPDLAGIHFTGSTPVFQGMWKTIREHISKYKGYPRIVGETGGKDFVFVHKSADVDVVATAIVRGAFEFQGQKCSAASRGYIPKSMWNELKGKVVSRLETVKMGDPEDFTNFVNAVIDKGAFETITGYIDYIKNADNAEIVFGGNYDDSVGYFIEPTFVVTTNPNFKTMEEEIFGPVFTLYVYDDEKYEETLNICNQTSPYALTGAIFAKDRNAVELANKILVNAAGNFYINDKPTGAVVGQQPFGGARASGTNDKAGSYLNLIRWVSPRTIKENFIPPTNYEYPFMEEE